VKLVAERALKRAAAEAVEENDFDEISAAFDSTCKNVDIPHSVVL
jgi:hypothetical protein